jgi:hypothetical protein
MLLSDGLYYDCYRIRTPGSFPLAALGPVQDRGRLLWSKDSPLRHLPATIKVSMVQRFNQAACMRNGHDWKAGGNPLDHGPLFCGHCPAQSFGKAWGDNAPGEIGRGMVRP